MPSPAQFYLAFERSRLRRGEGLECWCRPPSTQPDGISNHSQFLLRYRRSDHGCPWWGWLWHHRLASELLRIDRSEKQKRKLINFDDKSTSEILYFQLSDYVTINFKSTYDRLVAKQTHVAKAESSERQNN